MILINSSPRDALKIFQPFLPIFVPVGIGCLLSSAEREGIKAFFIDEQIEDDVLNAVARHVKEIKPPYIFGFSVLTAAFKNAISVSRELKRLYPDSIILFGGIHPTAMPEDVLQFSHIDFVLRGEGEKSLLEVYRCVKAGKEFTHIDNLSYKKNGEIVHNKRSFFLDDLDSYPSFPYHRFNSKAYDLGFVISSRGCPYQCIFCSNRVTTGRKYRYRTAGVIAEELDMLYHKFDKRYILFLDDNMLVSKKRVYDLLDEIKQRDLHKKMTFNFQARGDNVDYKLLQDLYSGGFRSVFFGLETSSERLMKVVKKGETVAQCREAVTMAKEIGFHVSATFIYAIPGETHQDRMDCVKMSRELQLDMVRYNNATPYPGTELYEIAKMENRLNVKGMWENFNSVSTFIENPFNRIPFSYIPEGNSEEDIRRDILFSYFSYYLDVEKLRKIFSKPEYGVGWFNAGERFIDVVKKIPALASLSFMLFLKFNQLFYYTVLKRDTAISFKHFFKIFNGLWQKKNQGNNA